jgi:hypothetical protein
MAKITSSIPLLGGVKIHNDLNGLNDGDYKHLTELEKIKTGYYSDAAMTEREKQKFAGIVAKLEQERDKEINKANTEFFANPT